eukprot:366462-Chlamydomonas_euryale.AAC.44
MPQLLEADVDRFYEVLSPSMPEGGGRGGDGGDSVHRAYSHGSVHTTLAHTDAGRRDGDAVAAAAPAPPAGWQAVGGMHMPSLAAIAGASAESAADCAASARRSATCGGADAPNADCASDTPRQRLSAAVCWQQSPNGLWVKRSNAVPTPPSTAMGPAPGGACAMQAAAAAEEASDRGWDLLAGTTWPSARGGEMEGGPWLPSINSRDSSGDRRTVVESTAELLREAPAAGVDAAAGDVGVLGVCAARWRAVCDESGCESDDACAGGDDNDDDGSNFDADGGRDFDVSECASEVSDPAGYRSYVVEPAGITQVCSGSGSGAAGADADTAQKCCPRDDGSGGSVPGGASTAETEAPDAVWSSNPVYSGEGAPAAEAGESLGRVQQQRQRRQQERRRQPRSALPAQHASDDPAAAAAGSPSVLNPTFEPMANASTPSDDATVRLAVTRPPLYMELQRILMEQ